MSKTKQLREKDICTVLRRHSGQRTVLAVAIPVLAAHITATKNQESSTGLTEKQIEAAFEELTSRFIKSDYHSTYIDRRLGARGFLSLSNGRYKIRSELLKDISLSDLEVLHGELVDSLASAYEERQAVIQRLKDACLLPRELIQERYALVGAYLSQLTGNRGEMFEVVSFAVLREYFRTFGFSLQRFSTTHANDGGMDFVGGEAIYQVTTDESSQKIRKDLAKAPGTKRVLVRPTLNAEIEDLSHGDVLETIELNDLLNHFISWLLARDKRSKQARHLQEVLETALKEFQRENRAERSEVIN